MTQTPQSKLVPCCIRPPFQMAWRHLLVELQRAFHRKRFEDRQRNELLDLLAAPGRYALRVGDDYSIDPACPM